MMMIHPWEYKVLSVRISKLEAELNTWGENSWELVNILFYPDGTPNCKVVFKRPA